MALVCSLMWAITRDDTRDDITFVKRGLGKLLYCGQIFATLLQTSYINGQPLIPNKLNVLQKAIDETFHFCVPPHVG